MRSDRDREDFTAFVERVELRLRRALIAAYGLETGEEATRDALAYAWEHWDRVKIMGNPAGYLYRVGQSGARRLRRWRPFAQDRRDSRIPDVEPGLHRALQRLPRNQRVAVVLVHGFCWSAAEVAELLEIAPTTVRSHVERALGKLRAALEVEVDA